MLQKLQRISADKREARENGDAGFTLIELLVVVVIIGILIAIAIPLYLNYQKGAHDKSAQSDLRGAVSTVNQCYTDNSNAYPTTATGSGTKNADLVFACGTGNTETAKASDGTTLTYTYVASASGVPAHYTLASTNDGGTKTYNYDSSVGGKIG